MVNGCAKYITGTIFLILLFSVSAFADVNVSAEGTYTDTQLTVNLYVDTTDTTNGADDPIISYGVKLLYNISDLSVSSVTKNDTDWFFGTQGSPLPTPNAAPDTSTDGEVVIVGGKIDQAAPTSGVSGPKVLLATVVFDRTSANVPNVTLDLGKGGSYSNFVTNLGHEIDGTNRLHFLAATISPECVLVGDINGDGSVDLSDYGLLRANFGATGPNEADINNDGQVDLSDYGLLRANFGTSCQ